jgi:hypothetical protein
MSWITVNKILGLAATDQDFYQDLQKNPLEAVQTWGFELTIEEQEVFRTLQINDLAAFSQQILERLRPGKS